MVVVTAACVDAIDTVMVVAFVVVIIFAVPSWRKAISSTTAHNNASNKSEHNTDETRGQSKHQKHMQYINHMNLTVLRPPQKDLGFF